MPSPTFDGDYLFSSLDANGNRVDEGVLFVPDYQQITQRLHFEGETGDYTLFHGYPDMAWEYRGYLSASSWTDFGGLIGGIQTAIDQANSDPDMYKVLVTSFGTNYAKAQVRTLHVTAPHITAGGGWLAQVLVTGVVQGNDHLDNNGGGGS